MKTDILEVTACRLCGSEELTSVFDLGTAPLSGIFPGPIESVPRSPLELVKCSSHTGCGLVQLRHSCNPTLMYGENYGYRSGLNPSMIEHLRSMVEIVMTRKTLEDGDIIIDIGSNDGTTLGFYQEHRYKLIGVDPTGGKFRRHYRGDITLVEDFFPSEKLASLLRPKSVKVFTSFSMLYDLEDPIAFTRAIAEYLSDDGIWVTEQSYLPTMLQRNSFDTVCHEHLEYYGLSQIVKLAEAAGLILLDARLTETNGGSIVVIVGGRNYQNFDVSENVNFLLGVEKSHTGNDQWKGFGERVNLIRNECVSLLTELKRKGKTVYGLGASTKGNVLLHHYGLTTEHLPLILEVNPDKFGKQTPSGNIPIVSEDHLKTKAPDYFFVLPWHFRDNLIERYSHLNIPFIFPLPNLEIVQPLQK